MKQPWDFHPQLVDARLRVIADLLLDVLYDTESALSTAYDDPYTRGTATFGRQRNAVIQLCRSGRYPWLDLRHAAMDVTFAIDGVACRFFVDDPDSPRKPGFWKRNDADVGLFPPELGKPLMFRFVIEKARNDVDPAEVHFVGFDSDYNEVFRWQYSRSTPTLTSVDVTRPQAVELAPASAKIIPFPGEKPADDAADDQR